MWQTYLRERRIDSLKLVIPTLSVMVVVVGTFAAVALGSRPQGGDTWSIWLAVALSPLITYFILQYMRQDERQSQAGTLFVAAHLLLLTVVYGNTYSPQNIVPYLCGILIISSNMIMYNGASFAVWLASSGLMVGTAFWAADRNLGQMLPVSGPVLINLALAGIAFLATYDWELALEAVNEVRQKAQARRDELFSIKEALDQSNAQLRFSNDALDKARQEALYERDLRTRFMNNVSHELRTPLNAIVNFAHIIGAGACGPVTERQVDYLKRVEQAGWHSLNVLNDLLDLAQIQVGEFRLNLQPVHLQEICEDAMNNTRGLILESPIELIRDFPTQWPVVLADPVRLKQALINLLGNAAKYTDEGSIGLRVRQEGEWVQIMIADTGIGIAPEYHEVIFQEFRQVNEGDARKRVGTGLGLPITRHLIERHGGTLTLLSEPGKGSVFTMMLPAVVNEAALL
ncbi:MAG: HAMP domain-containing histidine kinase [Anaerolineae bacterium]|nr:HAMP domain-containing histidine kinase [Anaerolineae bacterium]